jgi:spermidine synthase
MLVKIDTRLFKINSDKGGFYEVFDSPFGRYLTLKSRFIGLHKNSKLIKNSYFYDLLLELKEKKDHFHQALFFGLGSGTMQNLLFQNFPNIKLTTVDSDPALLDIYKYFFEKEFNPKHQIIISDAFQFVKNSENVFDFHDKCNLVVVDFNLIGLEFFSEIFLKEAKKFLNSKGIFVVIFQRKNYLQNLETLKFVERLSVYYNKVTLVYSKNNILEVICSDI